MAPEGTGIPMTLVNQWLRDGRGGSPDRDPGEASMTDVDAIASPLWPATSHAALVSTED